jgi:hypothetical protein
LNLRVPRLKGGNYDWLVHPALAFVATRLAVLLAAYLGAVALPSLAEEVVPREKVLVVTVPDNLFLDVWIRWDSNWYLSIVREGYGFKLGHMSSTAFFPLYPMLVDVLAPLTGSAAVAGVLVSHLSLLGALVFVYRLTHLEFEDRATAQRAVYYIAAFPTAYFFSAIYTESTFLLFAVASMYFARRRLWAWAGLMGLLASATRSVGVLVWGAVLVEWLRASGWALSDMPFKEAPRRLLEAVRTDWRSLLFITLMPLGLLSFMVFLYVHFQDPVAFWTAQGAWFREALGPVATVSKALNMLFHQNLLTGQIDWPVAVNIASLIFGLVVSVAASWRLGSSYAVYTIPSLLIPASSSTWSLARFTLVLFPVFMILAWWGRHSTVDRVITIIFSVFLGVFTTIIANWGFLF